MSRADFKRPLPRDAFEEQTRRDRAADRQANLWLAWQAARKAKRRRRRAASAEPVAGQTGHPGR
jgi:hypothetical protein